MIKKNNMQNHQQPKESNGIDKSKMISPTVTGCTQLMLLYGVTFDNTNTHVTTVHLLEMIPNFF